MSEINYSSHASNLKKAQSQSKKNLPQKENSSPAEDARHTGLIHHINPAIDWLFGIALILAMLKDLLDIVNTALIVAGGIGEILIIIFTIFVSFIIFLIMIITGSVGKVKIAKNIVKRALSIIATFLAEVIPIIGLFPMETILVVVIFWLTLKERRDGAIREGVHKTKK